MAKEKESAAAAPASADAQDTTLPVVEPGTSAERIDNHALDIAPKEWAGRYEITHGSVRLGDKFYGKGAVLLLGADDGKNFSEAGIAERVEE